MEKFGRQSRPAVAGRIPYRGGAEARKHKLTYGKQVFFPTTPRACYQTGRDFRSFPPFRVSCGIINPSRIERRILA